MNNSDNLQEQMRAAGIEAGKKKFADVIREFDDMHQQIQCHTKSVIMAASDSGLTIEHVVASLLHSVADAICNGATMQLAHSASTQAEQEYLASLSPNHPSDN